MTTASDTGPALESARWPIGPITLDAKRTGKRRTGNPFAPFDEAGAGDGLTANLHGHEAGNGGHSQGEPTGYRASPRPDRWGHHSNFVSVLAPGFRNIRMFLEPGTRAH